MSKYLISIVDDDESFREAMTSLMKSLGFAVDAFQSAEQFLASPSLDSTSCLIADYNMPGATGLELHRQLVDSGHMIPVILVTAYPDETVKARALAAGVICYLGKTFDDVALLDQIRTALMQTSRAERRV